MTDPIRGYQDVRPHIGASPKLTAKRRKSLPKSEFGLPSQRKYPTDTPGRARAAKSRASEMKHKGRITAAQEAQIDRKADRKLSRKERTMNGRLKSY
jgi:hypothetical protein